MTKLETMDPINLSGAELWLSISILLYFLMNGAQVFETLVFVPKWGASPPQNFYLLLDGRGTSLKVFWMVLHSLHEIAFILAIIFCWKIDGVRNWLLVLFVIHLGVRIWTIAYFAPHIIEFQNVAQNALAPAELSDRVNKWQTLNYIRVGIFVVVSVALIPVCMKLFNLRT
ncbi:MAG TPA: hypothetical protein VKZ54_02940 [Membranihabitans sp.]|nr:hypothetical protein [Membranihabitans sp.]